MGLVNGKLQRDYHQNLFNHRCLTEIINYFRPEEDEAKGKILASVDLSDGEKVFLSH